MKYLTILNSLILLFFLFFFVSYFGGFISLIFNYYALGPQYKGRDNNVVYLPSEISATSPLRRFNTLKVNNNEFFLTPVQWNYVSRGWSPDPKKLITDKPVAWYFPDDFRQAFYANRVLYFDSSKLGAFPVLSVGSRIQASSDKSDLKLSGTISRTENVNYADLNAKRKELLDNEYLLVEIDSTIMDSLGHFFLGYWRDENANK